MLRWLLCLRLLRRRDVPVGALCYGGCPRPPGNPRLCGLRSAPPEPDAAKSSDQPTLLDALPPMLAVPLGHEHAEVVIGEAPCRLPRRPPTTQVRHRGDAEVLRYILGARP